MPQTLNPKPLNPKPWVWGLRSIGLSVGFRLLCLEGLGSQLSGTTWVFGLRAAHPAAESPILEMPLCKPTCGFSG